MYTDKEIEKLFDILGPGVFEHEKEILYLYDKENDCYFYFLKNDLYRLLRTKDKNITPQMINDAETYLDDLYDFLFETKLENVPLYINRYILLVKWRLILAK